MTVLHWFRRDLRLADNTALNAALGSSEGHVIPVFVFDDALLKGPNVAPARVQFMIDCLADLDAQLKARGSRLIIRRGDTAAELLRVAREAGATAVHFNRDYTPAARRRDDAVTNTLQGEGIAATHHKDAMVFEPDEILTGSKTPYTVFTPYKKAWRARLDAVGGAQVALTTTAFQPVPAALTSLALPTPKQLGFNVTQRVPKGGETIATRLLSDFCESHLNNYATGRDMMAQPGTSRLSPHFRFGTLSPRAAVRLAIQSRIEEASGVFKAKGEAENGADVWISELIWREFYMGVLWHFPHADKGSFKRDYDALKWGSGNAKKDAELFAAWKDGRTGYPVVDAAMRQLNSEAWMHNRARMIVASFLTKDLLLDWRLGEAHFMKMLVDGDPAANNGGWQWAASTGTDAQPYFRVFNPQLQSERFDPDGVYIRRYIPELARCPQEYIHDPSQVPPMLSLTTNTAAYPKPVVHHATQKDEILKRFKAIKGA
jgi:deoxyribodipyrimidine photo-lyase